MGQIRTSAIPLAEIGEAYVDHPETVTNTAVVQIGFASPNAVLQSFPGRRLERILVT